MQKFVVKKISRSTNITITAEDRSLLQCSDQKPQMSEDLEISSVKMSGYLKKKRNRVGGWNKLYFVLQNSLLMSYNSKEEYEKKLVSFKDVICLIPGNTVLLPNLEPRFTIASNLNTYYTFRCDDNRICSKWITAILECLSRDIDYEGNGKKSNSQAKNFSSQQNLSHRPKPMCHVNHSWENLPKTNWMTNKNGRILMELNYLNCNRAKLPIGAKTAQILQKCSDDNVITTAKRVNFAQHDGNHNVLNNFDHNELQDAYDKNCDQFRLHNNEEKSNVRQSKEVDRISKMFAHKSESQQRPGSPAKCNGNDYSEIGIEEQMQAISFGDETGDYSSIYNDLSQQQYHSVDSKRFNNKLNIEETYSEIDTEGNVKNVEELNRKTSMMEPSNNSEVLLPEYAMIDLNKKREARNKRSEATKCSKSELNDFARETGIYEDIGVDDTKLNNSEDKNIYELIDIPLRPSRKTRSLVWKNWSRMHIFDFTKRFKESSEDPMKLTASHEPTSKNQKASLTLSDFSKRFNYRSMRNKARKICTRNNSTNATSGSLANFDISNNEENVSSKSDKTI